MIHVWSSSVSEEFVQSILYTAAWKELGLGYSYPLKQAVNAFSRSSITEELLNTHVQEETSFRFGLPDDMSIKPFKIALQTQFVVFLVARFSYDISSEDWKVPSGHFGNLTNKSAETEEKRAPEKNYREVFMTVLFPKKEKEEND